MHDCPGKWCSLHGPSGCLGHCDFPPAGFEVQVDGAVVSLAGSLLSQASWVKAASFWVRVRCPVPLPGSSTWWLDQWRWTVVELSHLNGCSCRTQCPPGHRVREVLGYFLSPGACIAAVLRQISWWRFLLSVEVASCNCLAFGGVGYSGPWW